MPAKDVHCGIQVLENPSELKSSNKFRSESHEIEQSVPEKSSLLSLHSTGRDVPRIDLCPDNKLPSVRPTTTGQSVLARAPDLPQSLDAISPKQTVCFDHWKHLGNLTGTRPLVNNFSLSRYSPGEWRLHNVKPFKRSRNEIQRALIIENAARCCATKAFAETDKNQLNNDIRLAARAGIIFHWKIEVQHVIEKIVDEISVLRETLRRTMRSSATLRVVENICKDTQQVRSHRMEPDLVRDNVDEELIKESFLCQEIRDMYNRLLEQIKMYQNELRSAKQRLDFDWSEKQEAYEIDCKTLELKSNSDNVLWKPGSVKIPADQSTEISYEYFAKEGIDQGQLAMQRSRELRSNVCLIIDKAVHDLRAQADRIDLALTAKIDCNIHILRRLENELSKVLQRISDMEQVATEMRKATRKLDGSMKCSQSRADTRLHRHKIESCRDAPQFGLIDEIKALNENATALLGEMQQADELTSNGLTEARRDLERELFIKQKSLNIDRIQCQFIRSFYPTSHALSGY